MGRDETGRDRTGTTRAVASTRDARKGRRAGGPVRYVFFYFFVLSTLLFFSLFFFRVVPFPWRTTTGGAGRGVTDAGGCWNH